MAGQVAYIFVATAARAPMMAVGEAQAVPGRGLEGDRYFEGVGTFSKPLPDREITLVEAEALEGLKRDHGIVLEPGQTRRNVVTRGIALNELVGTEFRVGEVKLRGIRLCEPCSHLEALTGKTLQPGLVHRGGLRAQFLTAGTIRVGDEVRA